MTIGLKRCINTWCNFHDMAFVIPTLTFSLCIQIRWLTACRGVLMLFVDTAPVYLMFLNEMVVFLGFAFKAWSFTLFLF